MATITEITYEKIIFSDGNELTHFHDQFCCEENYADFEQLDDIARNCDFDTTNMKFELVEGSGFRLGNEGRMFFIPCYSEQNGFYSSDVSILWNGEPVLEVIVDI